MEKVDNWWPQRRWALGVFAKAPAPGHVKTRLCPPLSATEAAVFYHLALAETVRTMAAGPFDLTIFQAGEENYFAHHFPRVGLAPQGDGDLGMRMERALGHLLASHPAAVLVGSDAPDLPVATVQRAFSLLGENDFVTAPAVDGGYVLVGCRRPCPELFREIAWSTREVLPVTRQRAADLGISYAEVPGWEDVDDLASLQRFLQRSPSSPSSRFAARVLNRRLTASQADCAAKKAAGVPDSDRATG